MTTSLSVSGLTFSPNAKFESLCDTYNECGVRAVPSLNPKISDFFIENLRELMINFVFDHIVSSLLYYLLVLNYVKKILTNE